MSDAVTIALITGSVSTIASMIAAIVSIVNARTIKKLEVNTNSIKDALVESTRLAASLKGNAEGIQSERNRMNAEMAAAVKKAI